MDEYLTLTLRSLANASGVMACSKIIWRCASRCADASFCLDAPAAAWPVGSARLNPSGISEGATSDDGMFDMLCLIFDCDAVPSKLPVVCVMVSLGLWIKIHDVMAWTFPMVENVDHRPSSSSTIHSFNNKNTYLFHCYESKNTIIRRLWTHHNMIVTPAFTTIWLNG